jgi:hypothetical protein
VLRKGDILGVNKSNYVTKLTTAVAISRHLRYSKSIQVILSLLIKDPYVLLLLLLLLYGPLLGLGRFFSFLILYTVDRTPWIGDQLVTRPLPTHRATQTQNKRTQASMPRVGFEPTIPAFERAKTVHAIDRPVSVIGKDAYVHVHLSKYSAFY